MKYIDLHVHSTVSDGSFTPSELVNYAVQKNLCAFALTDHDTIDGIDEAMHEASRINNTVNEPIIQVIPGIELSSDYNGKDIHILGLNIDYKNAEFLKELESFKKSRNARNEKLLELLNQNGFNITTKKIKYRFGNAILTRAHFAILMVEGGYVKDKNIAFNKYLNPGCPCYVQKSKISVKEAIDIILKANGKPILAHPLLYKLSINELDRLIAFLKSAGLLGIEAIYSSNKWENESRMKQLAKKYNLFITGGTDFHGLVKPNLELGTGYGNMKISADLLKNIL